MKRLLPLILLPLALSARADATVDLLRAAALDRGSHITRMLREGTDPNLRNEKRQTALHVALMEESASAVEALLADPRTDVNAINQAGETPVMLAALRGRLAWVQQLARQGAVLNEPGWNALHYAASGPDNGCVRWLVEQGVPIDSPSPNGSSPLMMAAGYGLIDSAEWLLRHGADAKLRNQQGLNAAEFARRAGRDELHHKLLAAAQKP